MATQKKTAPQGRAVDIRTEVGEREPLHFEVSDTLERRVDLVVIQSNLKANREVIQQIRDQLNDLLQNLDGSRAPYYGADCETVDANGGIIHELDEVTLDSSRSLGDVKIILELIQKRITG